MRLIAMLLPFRSSDAHESLHMALQMYKFPILAHHSSGERTFLSLVVCALKEEQIITAYFLIVDKSNISSVRFARRIISGRS
jgi:hypothetical protein